MTSLYRYIWFDWKGVWKIKSSENKDSNRSMEQIHAYVKLYYAKIADQLRWKLYSKRMLWYNGSMQERRNYIANALRLRFFCIKPSICIIAGREQFKIVTIQCQNSYIPVMEVLVNLRWISYHTCGTWLLLDLCFLVIATLIIRPGAPRHKGIHTCLHCRTVTPENVV